MRYQTRWTIFAQQKSPLSFFHLPLMKKDVKICLVVKDKQIKLIRLFRFLLIDFFPYPIINFYIKFQIKIIGWESHAAPLRETHCSTTRPSYSLGNILINPKNEAYF